MKPLKTELESNCVVFNPSTSTVDPNSNQGVVPLRFSDDPLTVVLPTERKAP